MNTIRLECTVGGHNKFYEFHGTETKGRFTVKALYGRIGQAASETIIYDGDSKLEANKEFERKMVDKKRKGYVVVSNNGKSAPAPTEKKRLIFQ